MAEFPPEIQGEKLTPTHHPGLNLIRATEAAALAAGRWMGLADKEGADHAAQDAMFAAINLLPMQGRIVCGEEHRVGSHSPLDSGGMVGTGEGPELDVELNAIDGAFLVAEGRPGAIAVAALAPVDCMWRPGPSIYLNKLVVDHTVADALTPEALDAPPAWTLALVARQKGKDIRDLCVFIMERPRHEALIAEVRKAGARVFLRTGGDVGGALLAADPNAPIDLLMGIGGSAEGLISACAIKALGGSMLGRIAPQSDHEKTECLKAGLDVDRILTCGDMVKGNEIYFAATGISTGVLLDGVSYHGDTVETHTLALRLETGSRRIINTEHTIK